MEIISGSSVLKIMNNCGKKCGENLQIGQPILLKKKGVKTISYMVNIKKINEQHYLMSVDA